MMLKIIEATVMVEVGLAVLEPKILSGQLITIVMHIYTYTLKLINYYMYHETT